MAGYFKGCKTLSDDIADGSATGYSPFFMSGLSNSINGSYTGLWPLNTAIVYPPSAIQMEIFSNSNADDFTPPSSTGAHKVLLNYLDNAYIERSELLELNGGTHVLTQATNILRVNSMHVTVTGTGKTNSGVINLRDSSANTYEQILNLYGNSTSCRYTVPAGKTLYLTGMSATATSTAGGKNLTLYIKSTSEGNDVYSGIFLNKYIAVVRDNGIAFAFPTPIKIPATADVQVVGLSDALAAVTAVANVWGYLKSA